MIGWIRELAVLAIVVTVFMSGRNMGRQEIRGLWDADKALKTQQVASQERDYAAQISAVQAKAVADRVELERLRAAPVSRVMCRSTTPAAVHGAPAAASSPATGAGELSPSVEFDPTDALYAEADRADTIVEDCREALARWPAN